VHFVSAHDSGAREQGRTETDRRGGLALFLKPKTTPALQMQEMEVHARLITAAVGLLAVVLLGYFGSLSLPSLRPYRRAYEWET